MRNLLQIWVALALLAFMSSSCSVVKNNFLQKSDQPYLQSADNESVAKYQTEPYKIQNRDQLSISLNSRDASTNIFFNKEAGGTQGGQVTPGLLYLKSYTVSDAGIVNLPIIGDVTVAGKTTEEIEKQVSEEMKKHVLECAVSVKLSNFRVTVMGEVMRPGTFYFYETKTTLLQAISMAGDFDEFANRKRVRIVREYPDKTETFILDLNKTDFLSSDQFILRTGDVIYVEPLRSKVFATNTRVLSVVLSAISATVTLIRIIQTW